MSIFYEMLKPYGSAFVSHENLSFRFCSDKDADSWESEANWRHMSGIPSLLRISFQFLSGTDLLTLFFSHSWISLHSSSGQTQAELVPLPDPYMWYHWSLVKEAQRASLVHY